MLKIAIIVGSTRPGRVGDSVARWVHELAAKRKDAGFEIADRIRLYYGGEGIADAMREHEAYVRAETLAVDTTEGAPPPSAHAETADVDGRTVTLGVEKA